MKRRLFVLIICLVLLHACSDSMEFGSCKSQVDEGLLVSVSEELKSRGIKHSLEGGRLCHRTEDKFDVDRALALVASYRNAVATILRDKDTEIKILEWLTAENKEYQITTTTEGQRFLVVFSSSRNDEVSNRAMLSRLERDE